MRNYGASALISRSAFVAFQRMPKAWMYKTCARPKERKASDFAGI